MSKNRPLEGLSPSSIDLDDEQILDLHGCIKGIPEEGADCSVIGCETDPVACAVDFFDAYHPVCVGCLLRVISSYWYAMYESDEEFERSIDEIEKSLDPDIDYVRPKENVKPLTTKGELIPKWEDGKWIKSF